ncbi:hypothetical protein ACX0G7_10225 [Flavitalea antarctica]
MEKRNLKTDFDSLKDDIFLILTRNAFDSNFKVSTLDQQREIGLLKQTMNNERFFFVVNLMDFELEEINGVSRYLGYSERDFTFKRYWNGVIHPGKEALKLLARQMYEILCSGQYPLEFMVQRFTSMVPLKHSNGHYILTKKTSSVFQYSSDNRLLSYIDEFTIIGDYNGEPLNPRMWFDYNEKDSTLKKQMLSNIMKDFEGMKIFAAKEFQIARKIAYNPNITPAELAQEFELQPSSINTYYKRFLEKARDYFQMEFESMSDAAKYLRRECIL